MACVRMRETPFMSIIASSIGPRSSPVRTSRAFASVRSTRSFSSGCRRLPNSRKMRSFPPIIPSSLFFSWRSSLRFVSAALFAVASSMIFSISDCERPPAGLI